MILLIISLPEPEFFRYVTLIKGRANYSKLDIFEGRYWNFKNDPLNDDNGSIYKQVDMNQRYH